MDFFKIVFLFLTVTIVLQCASDAQESASEQLQYRLPQRSAEGMYGYINLEGHWVINAQYDTVTVFNNKGFAFVRNKEGWNCIDSAGNVMVSNIEPRLEFGSQKSWRIPEIVIAPEIVWIQMLKDTIALLHTELGSLGVYEMDSAYNKDIEVFSAIRRQVIRMEGGAKGGWRSIFVNGHTILFDENWKEYGHWVGVSTATTADRFYVNDSDSTTIVYDYDNPDNPLKLPYMLRPYSRNYPGLEVQSHLTITEENRFRNSNRFMSSLFLQGDNRVMFSILMNSKGDTLLFQDYPARSGIYACENDIGDAPRGAFACTSPSVELSDQYQLSHDDYLEAVKRFQKRVLVDDNIPNPLGPYRLVANTDSTWWVLSIDTLKLVTRDSKQVLAKGPTTQFGKTKLEEYFFTQVGSGSVSSPYSDVFATPEGVYKVFEGRFKKIFDIENSSGERTARAEHHLFAAVQLLSIGIEPSETPLNDPNSGWLLGNVWKVSEDMFIGMCANKKWGIFDASGSVVKPPIYDVLLDQGNQISEYSQEGGFSVVVTLSDAVVKAKRNLDKQIKKNTEIKQQQAVKVIHDDREIRHQHELTNQLWSRFPDATRIEDWVPRVIPHPTIHNTKHIKGVFKLPAEWRYVQPKTGGGKLVRIGSE